MKINSEPSDLICSFNNANPRYFSLPGRAVDSYSIGSGSTPGSVLNYLFFKLFIFSNIDNHGNVAQR